MGPARFRHPNEPLQQRARSAVLKALAIDPNLAQAHLDMARVEFWAWNWNAAEREFKRAIELDPNLAKAHELYSAYLQASGRVDEAWAESERSQALDPSNGRMAWMYYTHRQFDRFIDLERNEIVVGHHGAMTHFDLGFGYERSGQYKEAVEQWETAMIGFGYPRLADALRRGYSRAGFQGAVRAWFAGWESLARAGEPGFQLGVLGRLHHLREGLQYLALREIDVFQRGQEKLVEVHREFLLCKSAQRTTGRGALSFFTRQR